MSGFLKKMLISLFITGVLGAGFVFLMEYWLFTYIEKNFLDKKIIAIQENQLEKAVSAFDKYCQTIEKYNKDFLEKNDFSAFFSSEISPETLKTLAASKEDLSKALIGESIKIRLIDKNGKKIHFSEFPDDIIQSTDKSRSFADFTSVQQLSADTSFDLSNRTWIVRTAIKDKLGIDKGNLLQYFSLKSFYNDMIAASIVNFPSQVQVVEPSRITILPFEDETVAVDRSIVADGNRIFLYDASGKPVYFQVTRTVRNVSLDILIDVQMLKLNEILRITIMAVFMITIFFLCLLLLNTRQDPELVISYRLKKIQIALVSEYLEQKDTVDLAKIKSQISLAKAALKKDLFRGYSRIKKDKKDKIEALIDKSWSDITAMIGEQKSAGQSLGGVNRTELKALIQEALSQTPIIARTIIAAETTVVSDRLNSAGQSSKDEDLEALEEVEALEEAESVEEASVLEEAEVLGELEEELESEVLEEVEELEEVGPASEAVPVEEAQEILEAEVVNEIEESPETDVLLEAEELEEVAEFEEGDELEEADVLHEATINLEKEEVEQALEIIGSGPTEETDEVLESLEVVSDSVEPEQGEASQFSEQVNEIEGVQPIGLSEEPPSETDEGITEELESSPDDNFAEDSELDVLDFESVADDDFDEDREIKTDTPGVLPLESGIEELETEEQQTADELTEIARKEDLLSSEVDDFEDADDAPADELEIVYEITKNRRFFGFVDEDIEELLPMEQVHEAYLQDTGTGPDYYKPIPERFTAPLLEDLIKSRASEASMKNQNTKNEEEAFDNMMTAVLPEQVHELEELDLISEEEELMTHEDEDCKVYRLADLNLAKKDQNIIVEEDGIFRISSKAFKGFAKKKNTDFEHLVSRVTGADEESRMAQLFDIDIDLGVGFGEKQEDISDSDNILPVMEYIEDLDQLVIKDFDVEMQRFRWLKEVSAKLGSVAVSLYHWSIEDRFEHSISLGIKENPDLQAILLSADIVGKLMESCIVDLGSKQVKMMRKTGGDRLLDQIASVRIIPFYNRDVFYTVIFYFTNEVSADLKSFLPVLA